MAYNETLYSESGGNTGIQKCAGRKGVISKIIIAPAGTSFATEADALDFEVWETAINETKENRIYVFPDIFSTTDESQELTTVEGDAGKMQIVNDGRDAYLFELSNVGDYLYQQLLKFNGCNDWSAVLVYQNGQIEGQSSDGVKFEFRPLQMLQVLNRKVASGGQPTKCHLKVIFDDGDLFHGNGVTINPVKSETAPWNPNVKLIGIKDVKLVVTNPTTAGFDVLVTGIDGVPVVGLDAGDIYVREADGTPISIVTTLAESSDTPGLYSATKVLTAGSYTAEFRKQPLAITKYFESPKTTAFSVVPMPQ